MRQKLSTAFLLGSLPLLLPLTAACGGAIPRLAPVDLPSPLLETVFEGHEVTLQLWASCDDPVSHGETANTSFCLHADIEVATTGMVELSTIQVDLPPSYRLGKPIRPREALGGGGSGAAWSEAGMHEFSLALRPIDPQAPFAIFVDLAARGDSGDEIAAERMGPYLFQITADGSGLARLVE